MSPDDSESGFTLVELLVATVISAIVIGGIAGILIVTLGSYPRSAARISLSDNAQLLSSWLGPDVQSAAWNTQGIDTDPLLTTIPGCTATVPSSSNVVTLMWSDYNAPAVTFAAAYRQVGSELMRYYCKGGGLLSSTIVGRDLASPDGASAKQTVDSVVIMVNTVDLINGSGSDYSFSVSASRQTPAVRIFPVPDLTPSFLTSNATVAGTALPGAIVNLTIFDQANPPDTTSPPPITADVNGNWSVNVDSISWGSLRVGDLITFTVTSADTAGHTSTATTTSRKPLIPEVSTDPDTNDPANSESVDFLVTFPERIVTPLDSSHVTVTGPNGQELPKSFQSVNCLDGAPSGSECFEFFVLGLDTTDDMDDGHITFTVNAHEVQDAAGNWNLAATYTTEVWDLNLPAVIPSPPTPTSTQPLTLLIAFAHKLANPPLDANGDQLTVTGPAADLAVMQKDVAPVTCPASAPAGSQTCYTVTISNLPTTPAAQGLISVQVNKNAVTDTEYGGLNSASAPSAPIMWSTTLTIAETRGPSNMTIFSGVAAPGTLTVTICNDVDCSVPAPQPPITVDATGHWSTTISNFVLQGSQYAEASQGGQSVFTTLIGP